MVRISLFAVLVLAAPVAAQPTASPDMFVRMAGASDLYEMQSSQAVLQTTQNPAVRTFAQRMVKDHGKTTKTVMKAAKTDGITPPPPALDSAKAAMLQQLNASAGPARDALYIRQQATAHREALALHQGYAAGGTTPALKAAAAKAAPIVQHHIMMVDAIKTD